MQHTYYEEPPRRPSFWRRLGTVLALALLLGVGVFVLVVTRRFSNETLALIAGLLLSGIPLSFVMVLFGAMAFRQNRPRHEPQQQMMIPPMILQMPQQLPPPQQAWGGGNGDSQLTFGAPRTWDVVGGEE